MYLSQIFFADKNIISIDNKKNFKFFYQNFINIILKPWYSVELSKIHYLLIKMTILSSENYFLLVALVNSYKIIFIY